MINEIKRSFKSNSMILTLAPVPLVALDQRSIMLINAIAVDEPGIAPN